MSVTIFVLSDLHIVDAVDPLYSSVLKLLRQRAAPGDVVVLAGDVFDLFVGDKLVFLERYRDFLSALREAGDRGIRLHYIEGNHDFLLQRAFAGVPGLELHPHEVKIEQSGHRFLVVHGDTIDRSDLGYRALRCFFRSPVMRALVRIWPGKWLDAFGRASSEASRGRKPLLPGELPIERRERLRQIYRSYGARMIAEGYDFVVAGHCHDLDEMGFVVGGRNGQYINVGYPRIHGSMLVWNEGEPRIHREPLP